MSRVTERHVLEAFGDILEHISTADRVNATAGLQPVAESDFTWMMRVQDIKARVAVLELYADDQDSDVFAAHLDSVGAAVFNTKIALMLAQETRLP